LISRIFSVRSLRFMSFSIYAGVACSLSILGNPRGLPVRRMRRTLLRRHCLLTIDPGMPLAVLRMLLSPAQRFTFEIQEQQK
jgi:hypothetical protein